MHFCGIILEKGCAGGSLHLFRKKTGQNREKAMRTAIITDTNSGLTVEEGKKAGVYVLPMPVIVDGHSYLEGVDMTHSKLYEALREERDVCTSQPSPGDVMELWDSVFREGYDEIVYIPMTSGLSSSCESASQYALDYGSKVHVVDNHRISATLTEAVFDAKTLADNGYPAAEIKAILEDAALHASIYITVNSLKYLKKSGRITSSAAAIANLLNIKPVLTIQGEKLDLFAKARGIRQSEKKMIEALKSDIAERFPQIPLSRLQVATAGTLESREEEELWRAQVQAAFPRHQVRYYPLSCSIACHVGVGAVGIAVSVTEEVVDKLRGSIGQMDI